MENSYWTILIASQDSCGRWFPSLQRGNFDKDREKSRKVRRCVIASIIGRRIFANTRATRSVVSHELNKRKMERQKSTCEILLVRYTHGVTHLLSSASVRREIRQNDSVNVSQHIRRIFNGIISANWPNDGVNMQLPINRLLAHFRNKHIFWKKSAFHWCTPGI